MEKNKEMTALLTGSALVVALIAINNYKPQLERFAEQYRKNKQRKGENFMQTTKEMIQQIQTITYDAYRSSSQVAALLKTQGEPPEAMAKALERTAARWSCAPCASPACPSCSPSAGSPSCLRWMWQEASA